MMGVMLDVTPLLRPERAALLDLLASVGDDDWDEPTECPAYSIKGIATHLLGDDLSLLSRQRDGAPPGLVLVAGELPGADFRTVLDAFNDGWVSTARFLSPAVLIDLLRVSGDRTAEFYESVDLAAPCEPVFFFGPTSEASPYWQAIARELMERWVHQSQIRRALGRPSLADEQLVRTGVAIVAAAAGAEPTCVDGQWSIGPACLGTTQQTADVLTRAHTAAEVRALVTGPDAAVELAAVSFGR
jgi:uncharacterized protein (TIGR03083 family)